VNNLKAKQLFHNDHPEQANSKPYVKALIILQAKAQVYYSILANTKVIWTDAIPTGATDGVYVYLNKDFFRGLASDSQRAFLLAHEVAHIVLRHPQRGKAFLDRGFFRQVGSKTISYCPKMFNKAADYVINADLIKHDLEFIPDGLLDSDISRDELVDDVYMGLVNDNDDQPPNLKRTMTMTIKMITLAVAVVAMVTHILMALAMMISNQRIKMILISLATMTVRLTTHLILWRTRLARA